MGNISAPIFRASSPQQFINLLALRQEAPATKVVDSCAVFGNNFEASKGWSGVWIKKG